MSVEQEKGNAVDITIGGVKKLWLLRTEDVLMLEAELQVRRDERIGWNEFMQSAAKWTTQDWLLTIWAGLHHYGETCTVEDIAKGISMSELFSFQSDERSFISWINNLQNASGKKKEVKADRQRAK